MFNKNSIFNFTERRMKMNDAMHKTKEDCVREKISGRTIGLLILGFSVLLSLAGVILLPVFGFFYALPLFILGMVFVIAPESKVCKLLTKKTVSS